MRFLTWNIHSGGGKRVSSIVDELARLEPDVIALTEVTYANLEQLRGGLIGRGFAHIATTCAAGTVNSVLVASRVPFTVIDDHVAHDPERWLPIKLEGSNVKVLCVHIPGGTDNKFNADGVGISGKKRKELLWDEVIRFARQERDGKTVLLGDFNPGLAEDAQGTPFVLSDYIRVLRLEKYVDTWRHLNPKAREYTWFTKRKNKEAGVSEDYNGFRLDYVYVSSALRSAIVDARHVHEVRSNSISDHAMVVADLSIDASADGTVDFSPFVVAATGSREETVIEPTALTSAALDSSHDSLLSALTKARIPVENHEFIRRFTASVGIRAFRAISRPDKPYVIATRRDGLPDLHIFYGYTTGFTSEQEIVRAAGTGTTRAPSFRKGTWYVTHPTNQVRPSGARARDVRREAASCRCGMQLSVTGVCSSCD